MATKLPVVSNYAVGVYLSWWVVGLLTGMSLDLTAGMQLLYVNLPYVRCVDWPSLIRFLKLYTTIRC